MFLNIRTGNTIASLEVDCDTGTRLLESVVKDFLPFIQIEEYELSYKRKYDTVDSSADLYKILVGIYSQGTVYDVKDSTTIISKNKKMKESKCKLSEVLDYAKFYKKYFSDCVELDIPNYNSTFKNLLSIYADIAKNSYELLKSLSVTTEDVSAYRLLYRDRYSKSITSVSSIDTKDSIELNVIVKDLGRRLQDILKLFEECTKELAVFDSRIGDIVTKGFDTVGILNC